MVSFSSIGAFASGIGSLASGLGLGGGKKGPTAYEAALAGVNAEKERALQLPRYIVQGAKKAGLHPLAVMGTSTPISVSAGYNGDKGVDFAQMGQGIDRALNAGRSATQRKLDELAVEKAGLENDYLRTQIAGSQKAIAGTGSTVAIRSNTDDTGNVEIVPHKVVSKSYEDGGRAAGLPPGFMQYDLGNGQTIELPYSEEGPSEALENLPLGLDYLKFAELYGKRNMSKSQLRAKWKRYKQFERSIHRQKFYDGIVKPIYRAKVQKYWKK
jgi:hypothetical protein